MRGPTVSLIIPCYNEIEGLPPLVERLQAMRDAGRMPGWEVILVDDGSRDGTTEALDELGARYEWVRVVHHPVNRGLGAAVRTGFLQAAAPVICTMDSDCTFAPESLPRMVEMLNEGADIVTASPWHPESEHGTVHPFRKLLSKGVSLIYRLILGDQVHSFTPMHRAYRREVFKRVQFHSDGFAAIAEILIRAMFKGFRVKELPMRVDRRIYGDSKIDIVRSIAAHLSLIRLASWTAFTTWADMKLAAAKLVIEE
jgi:dolichol-phosphate mannosyltransferase